MERSLLDSFSNPKFAAGAKEVAKAFYEANHEKLVDYSKLAEYLKRYPNRVKLSKTLGFFIDTFAMIVPDDFYTAILEQSLGNYIWLESRGKNIGK